MKIVASMVVREFLGTALGNCGAVKANAEEVGLRTTAAVVQAIFLVIVIDAFFAVFFTWVGWN